MIKDEDEISFYKNGDRLLNPTDNEFIKYIHNGKYTAKLARDILEGKLNDLPSSKNMTGVPKENFDLIIDILKNVRKFKEKVDDLKGSSGLTAAMFVNRLAEAIDLYDGGFGQMKNKTGIPQQIVFHNYLMALPIMIYKKLDSSKIENDKEVVTFTKDFTQSQIASFEKVVSFIQKNNDVSSNYDRVQSELIARSIVKDIPFGQILEKVETKSSPVIVIVSAIALIIVSIVLTLLAFAASYFVINLIYAYSLERMAFREGYGFSYNRMFFNAINPIFIFKYASMISIIPKF